MLGIRRSMIGLGIISINSVYVQTLPSIPHRRQCVKGYDRHETEICNRNRKRSKQMTSEATEKMFLTLWHHFHLWLCVRSAFLFPVYHSLDKHLSKLCMWPLLGIRRVYQGMIFLTQLLLSFHASYFAILLGITKIRHKRNFDCLVAMVTKIEFKC